MGKRDCGYLHQHISPDDLLKCLQGPALSGGSVIIMLLLFVTSSSISMNGHGPVGSVQLSSLNLNVNGVTHQRVLRDGD